MITVSLKKTKMSRSQKLLDDRPSAARLGSRESRVHGLRPEAGPVLGRKLLEFEVEDPGERVGGERSHLVDRHRLAELAGDRRELGVLDPARRDPLRERRRVEVDVQGVAVRRDPLRDVDPDRGDLPRRPLQPDPGEALDPGRIHPERRERADQGLLEVAAVALHIGAVPRQVEDRVADELAGRVVGRLSAAVGLDDLHLGARREVQLGPLRAAAEGHDGRVLEENDRLRHRSLPDRGRERALEVPRLAVRRQAEVHQVRARAHAARPSRRTVQSSTCEIVSMPFRIHGSSANLARSAASSLAATTSNTRRSPASGPPSTTNPVSTSSSMKRACSSQSACSRMSFDQSHGPPRSWWTIQSSTRVRLAAALPASAGAARRGRRRGRRAEAAAAAPARRARRARAPTGTGSTTCRRGRPPPPAPGSPRRARVAAAGRREAPPAAAASSAAAERAPRPAEPVRLGGAAGPPRLAARPRPRRPPATPVAPAPAPLARPAGATARTAPAPPPPPGRGSPPPFPAPPPRHRPAATAPGGAGAGRRGRARTRRRSAAPARATRRGGAGRPGSRAPPPTPAP